MLNSTFFEHQPSQDSFIETNPDLEIVTFNRNDTISAEGHKNEGVFFVESGIVKRFVRGMDGRESIFDFCGKGDFFGHRSIISEEPNFDSAVCLTDVKLSFIPRKKFIETLNNNEEVLKAFIVSLSAESISHIRLTQLLGQFTLKQRVAYALLYLQSKNSDSTNWTVLISREDLANYIGTVKESAVRILHELKKDDILSSSGKRIFVKLPQELHSLSKNMLEKKHPQI